MAITPAPDNDVDVTILINTPDLEEDATRITDEMRVVMTQLLDPEIETWELSFVDRKYARQWRWLD